MTTAGLQAGVTKNQRYTMVFWVSHKPSFVRHFSASLPTPDWRPGHEHQRYPVKTRCCRSTLPGVGQVSTRSGRWPREKQTFNV